jgi:hypothetical protein
MVCISRIWLAALAISIAVGCAGATVERGPQYAQDRPLPRPPVLVVYDFAVDANDVVVDTFGPNFLQDTASHSKEVASARTVASSLSETLVAELGKRGIRAQRATHASPPPLNAAVVKGQFLTIQEGDRTARMLIGLVVEVEKLRVRLRPRSSPSDPWISTGVGVDARIAGCHLRSASSDSCIRAIRE